MLLNAVIGNCREENCNLDHSCPSCGSKKRMCLHSHMEDIGRKIDFADKAGKAAGKGDHDWPKYQGKGGKGGKGGKKGSGSWSNWSNKSGEPTWKRRKEGEDQH